jgi:hypothetical protein
LDLRQSRPAFKRSIRRLAHPGYITLKSLGPYDVIFLFVSIALSSPQAHGCHIGIETRHDELRQLAIPRASVKRSYTSGRKLQSHTLTNRLASSTVKYSSRALSTPLSGFTMRHAKGPYRHGRHDSVRPLGW